MDVLITTHFVKDFDLGANGNLYGGRMLDWLDEAGALFVHDIFNECFVTWKIGETIFHKSVKAKSIVKFYVKNADVRNSSIGFDIVVRTKNEKVITTSMVFVCVDPETGEKKNIDNIEKYCAESEFLRCCMTKRNGVPVEVPEEVKNRHNIIFMSEN